MGVLLSGRHGLALAFAFGSLFGSDIRSAAAQTGIPAWNNSLSSNVISTTPPVAPAVTASQAASQPRPATSIGSGSAPLIVPQVAALARDLKYSPDLIYQYVHDNVQTLPEYGSLKGPLGPILDGSGTVFDQAELMQQLLLVTPSYNNGVSNPQIAVGEIQLTGAQLSSWLGTSSAASMETILQAGGFPATYSVTGDTMNFAEIEWAWVTVEINGTTHAFDPATKSFSSVFPGFGASGTFASEVGYSQSKLLSDFEVSSSTCTYSYDNIGLSCMSGFNTFTGDLRTYGVNFAAYLTPKTITISPQMAIGESVIAPLELGTELRQPTLPYQVAAPTIYSFIPVAYRASFGIQMPGTTTFPTWNTSDLYGHRVTLAFSSSDTASLYLDIANPNLGTVSGSETILTASPQSTGPDTQTGIAIFIHHPYGITPTNQAYNTNEGMDGSAEVYFQSSYNTTGGDIPGVYSIVMGLGPTGRGMAEKHRDDLQAAEALSPSSPNSEPVLGAGLAELGYTWLAERSQAQQVLGGASNTTLLVQQELGVVGMKGLAVTGSTTPIFGPYIDIPTNTVSVIQRATRPAVGGSPTQKETGAFFTDQLIGSALEGGIIQQTQPGSSAFSTTDLITANVVYTGDPKYYDLFDINNSVFPTDNCDFYAGINVPVAATGGTRLQLQSDGYTTADLVAIDAIVGYNSSTNTCASGNYDRVVSTAYGNFYGNSFGGAGYLDINQAGTTIRALITGNLSGGISASPVSTTQIASNTPASNFPDSQTPTAPQIGSVQGGGSSVQPGTGSADLVSGSFTYSHTDLSIGSGGFPYELSYKRSYDSGNRLSTTGYGYGWSGSLTTSAKVVSDPYEALGTTSAVSAAPAIASLYAAQDILTPTGSNATPSLLQIAVGAATVQWFVGNFLDNNAVAVTRPGSIQHFVTLGNGTYSPPLGSASTLTYNSSASTFSLKAKTGEVEAFDTYGNLQTWTSPAGPVVTVGYTNPGSGELPASISNNMGRSLSLTWSGSQLEKLSDTTGRSVSYGYDGNGNLTSVTDAVGEQTTFAYEATYHNLTTITTPTSDTSSKTASTTLVYDPLNMLEAMTNPDNNTTLYYFAGSRSEVDDPLGDAQVSYFNASGLDVGDYDPDQDLTMSRYDALNRLILRTNPSGTSTIYGYDTKNNLIETTETPSVSAPPNPHPGSSGPLPSRSKFSAYDPVFNRPTQSSLGWSDQPVVYKIDSTTGNVDTMTMPSATTAGAAGPVYSFTYDKFGRVVSKTAPDGTVTAYTYTANEDLASTTVDPTGLALKTQYAYGPVGNLTQVLDPRGIATNAIYDGLRRPTQVTPPADASGNVNTQSFTYDLNGQISVAKTALGSSGTSATNTYVYDAAGNLTSTTDSSGRTVSYYYDAASRRYETKTGNSYLSFTNFDSASRVLSHDVGAQTAADIVDSYTYSPDGVVTSYCYYQTAGTCIPTNYVIDGFDRVQQTTFPGGQVSKQGYQPDDLVDYEVQRSVADSITATYDYLREMTQRVGDTTSTYAYDSLSRLVNVKLTSDPSQPIWTMVYDRDSRLTNYAQPLIQSVNSSGQYNYITGQYSLFSYDADGNTTTFILPDGKTEYITYDKLNRPLSYAWAPNNSTTTHSSLWSDSYNFQGFRTGRTYTEGTGPFTSTWSYDSPVGVDLTTITHQLGSTDSFTFQYGYNDSHQANSFSETAVGVSPAGDVTPRPASQFLYGPLGTLTYNSSNEEQFASCSNANPCYGEAGNLLYDGTRHFLYDSEGDGRMLSATNGSTSASYAYDPFGRRTAKIVNGVVTAYALAPSGHEIEELTSGAVSRDLFFDPNDTAPVALLNASNTVTFNHTDKLGSVVLTTSNGAITNTIGYLPYGQTTTGTLSGTEFGYAGYRFDAETGVYHTQTRSYDPNFERFLQVDPTGYASGRNLYAYAGGDPINHTDPAGTDDAYPEEGDGGGGSDLGIAESEAFQEALAITGVQIDDIGSDYSSNGSLINSSDASGLAEQFTSEYADELAAGPTMGYAAVAQATESFSGTTSPPEASASTPTPIQVASTSNSLSGVVDPNAPQPETPVVPTGPLLTLLQIAEQSSSDFSTSIPQPLRGLLVHIDFANQVYELGAPFTAEQSYLNMEPVGLFVSGSSRADAVYGPIDSPDLAVDVKTGNAFLSQGQYLRYQANLPMGTQLRVLKVP